VYCASAGLAYLLNCSCSSPFTHSRSSVLLAYMLPSASGSFSFDCDVAMAREACTAAVYQLLLSVGVGPAPAAE
jgi:hypothetical protein